MTIKELLQLTVEQRASDLHLVEGSPPILRINGNLVPINNEAVLNHQIIHAHLTEVMSADQMEILTQNKEFDFSVALADKARFRVNAYTQKKSYAAAFRSIPLVIPQLETLGLPQILSEFTTLKQGFILVTGPTGHGKSTTLAAMLDKINANRPSHIVTIEDPIEFVFAPRMSIISQREVGTDTLTWNKALRSVLREDPDVVLVGEMRDYETIAAALTVAETGHLVFATLHTNSAAQTIDRIVDVFPEEQQSQVRLQLSEVLVAIVSQRLIPALDGGRVLAHEILVSNTAVKTEIREGKTHQIDSIIQTSRNEGMITLEHSLAALVQSNKISVETARSYSTNEEQLMRLVRT